MGLDFTRLAPADLVRLVNSTRLGTVITERQLYRHRMTAGLRIGDADPGGKIHLLRYAQWLASRLRERESMAPDKPSSDDARQYERHKAAAAHRQAEIAGAGQEIGPIPPVVDPERRARCRRNFAMFAKVYFGPIYDLPFCDDHLRAISKIERAVSNGELFALAMPRGYGKSTMMLTAVMWAALYGHHRFIMLIAATDKRARKLLDKVFRALEGNPLLFEDFPEVCWPVRKLERTGQRGIKQKCQGVHTDVKWKPGAGEIVLPKIAVPPDHPSAGEAIRKGEEVPDGMTGFRWSKSSGVILLTSGLTGGDIRGQLGDATGGGFIRPSLVLLDDPQTKASAKSPTQTQDRVELLQGDVLGMASHSRSFGAMMACTVIRPGDMADHILDPEKNPEWQGERTKMVYSWPTNTKLWDEYFARRAEGLRAGDGGRAGNDMYRHNRLPMDQGSKVAWEEGFPPDKALSTIQHAMNLRARDESMFFAEYQNEPVTKEDESDFLTADQIAMKVSGKKRGDIPLACNHLTLYQDVHDRLIYWMLCAWADNFDGYVIDYGTYPDQQRMYFKMTSAVRTMARVCQGVGPEGAIRAGLTALNDELLNRQWRRDDGAQIKVGMSMIDERYETNLIYRFINEYPCGYLYPSMGLPLKVTSPPFHSRPNKPGERTGEHCRMTPIVGKAHGRHLVIDTNYWKTFVHRRLATASGDRGCLSIFGRKRADGQVASITEHRLLAEHLTAEKRTVVAGPYGPVDIWENAGGQDNHWFDCLVGCTVMASWLGASMLQPTGEKAAKPQQAPRPRVKRRWER